MAVSRWNPEMSSKKPNILVIEDVPSLAATYAAFLARELVDVHIATTGQEAIAFMERNPVAAAIVDVHLPDMSGLEILRKARALGSPTHFIVITTEGSIKLAVEAMRDGAFDFIVKPLSRERLVVTVKNALDHRRLSNRLAEVAEDSREGAPGRFIGQSLAMQAVYRILRSAGSNQRDRVHHRRIRGRQGAVRRGAAQAEQAARRAVHRA